MQTHEYLKKELTDFITENIKNYLPSHNFSEVINYSVFPTGKLFRPILTATIAKDLGLYNDNHKFLAMSIELHHTYTLIHDDLPSMDDDDYRRGRLSSHKKFSQWQAILAGDALLNMSFEILSEIHPKYISAILKRYALATGPKGLILGQVKDLGNENANFDDILELHRLKTGELIQLSLSASAILSNREDLVQPLEKLGFALGENFQLIDDLCELTDEINDHEKDVNPFLIFSPQDVLDRITTNSQIVNQTCEELKLNELKSYIDNYIIKMKTKVLNNLEKVTSYIKIDQESISKF